MFAYPLVRGALAWGLLLASAARTEPAYTVSAVLGEESGLSHLEVTALAEDRHGFLWVGTADGLCRYDGYGFRVLRHDPSDEESLPSDRITALWADPEGSLWVGTVDGGLGELDTVSGAVRPVVELEGSAVTALAGTADGGVWVGTRELGLCRVPADADGDVWCTAPGLSITALSVGRGGDLWVGGRNGIYTFLTGSRAFEGLPNQADEEILSGERVSALFENELGVLWVGASNGLHFWKDRFDRVEGLRDLTIVGLEPSGVYQRIWVGTESQGLMWVDTSGELDPGVGRFAGEWGSRAIGAVLEDRFGVLWVGTREAGLHGFVPDGGGSAGPPPVVITRVETGESRTEREPLVVEGLAIELAPGQRDLTIEFAALDFRRPERNQFSFALDSEWSPSSTARRAEIEDLKPGDHVFRVRGAGVDGFWNEAGASLVVEVPPQVHERTVLWVGGLLAIVALLTIANWLRMGGWLPILDTLRPRWRHSDPEVAVAAVGRIDNQRSLEKIAWSDVLSKVAQAAIERLEDEEALSRIALGPFAPHLRLVAVERLRDADVMARILESEEEAELCAAAVARLADPKRLARVAVDSRSAVARKAAVETVEDAEVLARVAREDADSGVRLAAVERVLNPAALAAVLDRERELQVCRAAARRLDDSRQLARVATGGGTWAGRVAAVKRLDDQSLLAEIATGDEDSRVRSAAARRVESQSVLIEVARTDEDEYPRQAAVERLDDPAVLAGIAQGDDSMSVRLSAVERLGDQEVLAAIAENDPSDWVRKGAVERLDAQEVLARIASQDSDADVRTAARQRVTDPELVAELEKSEQARSGHPIPGMVYMEVPKPPWGGAVCSDDNCPCPEVPIPEGEGYMYVSGDVARLRRQYPSLEEIKAWRSQFGAGVLFGGGTVAPILTCGEGARLRGLNLAVAAQDAAYWWKTGTVPCRATPRA